MEQAPSQNHLLGTRGLVVFNVGDVTYGAPVDEVAGLLDADRLAALPGRSAPMVGVVAFRGSVVPVLELSSALGVEAPSPAVAYAVVMERGTDRFALLVHGMPRLVPARDVHFKEAGEPAEEGARQPIVLAVYEVGGVDVLAVDFWSLMDSIAPPAAFRLSGISGR